jgi:hypothetical protein
MAGIYWKHNGLSLSTGNEKVKSSKGVTLILNMGAASDCPSMKLGLCKICAMDADGLPVRCYAKSSEQFMPCTRRYREAQGIYWHTHTAAEIISDMDVILSKGKRGFKVKAFRFNESGDFTSRECIDKADAIAVYLHMRWNVRRIWTYSARSDLAQYMTDLSFIVKGSGWKGPDGQTIVVCGRDTPLPAHYRECPGDCSVCALCAVRGTSIAFRPHGGKTNISQPVDATRGAKIMLKFYGLSA